MKRTLFVFAAMLFGIVIAWQSSKADDEKVELSVRRLDSATQLELIRRIEALEKRLEKLEAEAQPVRQAEFRQPDYVPTPRMLPPTTVPDADEGSNRTNGQTWRIRMLSHRQSTNGPREN